MATKAPTIIAPANSRRHSAARHLSVDIPTTGPDPLRDKMERAVERPLSALDALDAVSDDREPEEPEPDGDDEPSGDEEEPSLGAPEAQAGHVVVDGNFVTNPGVDQSHWAQTGTDDLEAESDNEPSLGSLDKVGDQSGWGRVDFKDLEYGPAELGEPEDGI